MKENVSMDPTVLEGDRNKNELAILELESEGLVKTIKGQFTQYGRFILVSLTDKGVLKQHQLRKEMSEPTSQKIAKCGKSIGATIKDIAVGVATGVITNILSDKIPKP